MKMFDEIQIACDTNWGMYKVAQAIRSPCEALGLTVKFTHLITFGEIQKLLNGENQSAKHLVICCHGIEDQSTSGFKFECMMPKKENPNAFEHSVYNVNAESLKPLQLGQFETIVSVACKSGDKKFADKLIGNGVSYYIAAPELVDMLASIVFVPTFYYHLLYNSKHKPPDKGDYEEAVRKASMIDDIKRPGGTHLYRLFSK